MATDHSPSGPSHVRAASADGDARGAATVEVGPGVEPRLPADLRGGPDCGPAVPVHADSEPMMCLFVAGWFALTVTVLRCMIDALHVWNACMKFGAGPRWVPRQKQLEEGEVEEVRPKGKQKGYYLKSKKGLFLDFFVILPFMQVVLWVAAPALVRRGSTSTVMTVFLITFLFQYLPKIYHSMCFLRRMENFSGYVFGTIWWGIALNLIAYFVVSECDFIEAAVAAPEDEGHGLVDEEEAAAAGGPAVRAAAVGGDESRRQVPDGREFAGGIEEGHQVPSLSGPSETGSIVPTHE